MSSRKVRPLGIRAGTAGRTMPGNGPAERPQTAETLGIRSLNSAAVEAGDPSQLPTGCLGNGSPLDSKSLRCDQQSFPRCNGPSDLTKEVSPSRRSATRPALSTTTNCMFSAVIIRGGVPRADGTLSRHASHTNPLLPFIVGGSIQTSSHLDFFCDGNPIRSVGAGV